MPGVTLEISSGVRTFVPLRGLGVVGTVAMWRTIEEAYTERTI
jgi:hypothetical protein